MHLWWSVVDTDGVDDVCDECCTFIFVQTRFPVLRWMCWLVGVAMNGVAWFVMFRC